MFEIGDDLPTPGSRRGAIGLGQDSSSAPPVLACHWEFGDGSSMDGMEVTHAFAHAGDYTVQVTSQGLGATTNRKTFTVSVSGEVSTQFVKECKQRPE
jgi:PKD repeat protein